MAIKSYGPIVQELPSEEQNQLKLWVDLYHDGGLLGGLQSQMYDLWCEPEKKNHTKNVIFAHYRYVTWPKWYFLTKIIISYCEKKLF